MLDHPKLCFAYISIKALASMMFYKAGLAEAEGACAASAEEVECVAQTAFSFHTISKERLIWIHSQGTFR